MNYKAIDLRDASKELVQKVLDMKLRPIDILECRMVGVYDIRESLAYGMYKSEPHFCMIGLNTETNMPEFVWGVAPTEDPTVGTPWLLATSDFKITTDWLKRCKRDIFPRMNDTFPILRNFIHKDNHESIRWLKWLGFEFYEVDVTFKETGEKANAYLFTKLGGKSICATQL